MNKFFLMTRGRTGSTAVLDELNKSSSLCATQELFLKYNFDNLAPTYFEKLYDLLLPYDLWKSQKLALSSIDSDDNEWANRYLEDAEALAGHQRVAGFGFKVLSHNFDERSFLSALLKRRGYQAIYLIRNIARQVLSGMVAAQRGFYNTTENFNDLRRYQIDLNEFQGLVQWERQCVEKDLTQLKAEEFDFIVVSYEEFYAKRQSFYEKIFQFLGLPMELPSASDYIITIKDLKYTITNYDAVVERAAAIGMTLDS